MEVISCITEELLLQDDIVLEAEVQKVGGRGGAASPPPNIKSRTCVCKRQWLYRHTLVIHSIYISKYDRKSLNNLMILSIYEEEVHNLEIYTEQFHKECPEARELKD